MKKILLSVFVTTCAFFTIRAQEIINQTEQLKSLKTGKYIAFDVKKNKNGNYEYGDLKGEHELLSVQTEPNFPEHKYFEMKIYGTDENFIPDNMAFPVTYAKLFYEGNDKLKKQVGYVPREIRPGSTNRVCVVDGVVFDLSTKFKEDNAETHIPYRLYVHESFGNDFKETDKKSADKKKKKKLSLKERMEQAMMKKLANKNPEMKGIFNAVQKLKAMDAVGVVQNYLKDAVAKQKEVEPKWKQNANNAQRVKLVEERRELMFAAMKKYNDDLMDTPEWRRIQENNRLANAAAAKNNVTLKNDTGRDIYIYESGSMNGSRLNAGSSGSFRCSTSYYYAFDGNSGSRVGNAGPLAYSANSSCGGTVTVR
ncbi:hypothetical protein ABN763_04525 [Spongiivirga sp. MCCC 1A20706]|uniref:hypothetical protein n=1 Tax=Spongiivirga sp. MCCC 1A20706 TaxID=3160963 RepID=UPI00397725AE